MSIPPADLGDFLSGDTGKKKDFVQKVGKGFEQKGVLTHIKIFYSVFSTPKNNYKFTAP